MKAVFGDGAVGAYGFGAFNLVYRRPGVSNRKKKLRIHCEARSLVSPVHGGSNIDKLIEIVPAARKKHSDGMLRDRS